MQTPIIVNAANWKFKEELTQIEYYGIYAFVADAFTHAAEERNGSPCIGYTAEAVEHMFGFAPSQGTVACTNFVNWPGFEHLGPVDYFTLTDNHILCAVYVSDDEPNWTYLRLN